MAPLSDPALPPLAALHRMVVTDDGSGRLTAKNGYDRGEFLASSDERFRPASLFDGPDGNVYVVDMYRGVVQAGGLWSEYLTGYIKANDLELPVGKGRIWRVVYGDGTARRPDLVEPEGLVARYRAAPAGGARRCLRRTRAEDAGRKRARLADATARTLDARRPGRDRRSSGQEGAGGRQW